MTQEPEQDEFHVGYEPPMPRRLARFMTAVVAATAAGLTVWAAVPVTGHVPLEGGTFEYGTLTTVTGTFVARPYPALRPDAVGSDPQPWPLLVAPGKHGADAIVGGLAGRRVSLTGQRIQRGAYTMIEVAPASLVSGETSPSAAPADDTGDRLAGTVELTGEVVDSTCFLGVMVPGAGKTHRECASLCLRGGIPPALYVRDRAGRSSLILLSGVSGEPIGPQALARSGRPRYPAFTPYYVAKACRQ